MQAFTWEVDDEHKDTPKQVDGFNCGMYTTLYARFLAANMLLDFTAAEVNNLWRVVFALELRYGQLLSAAEMRDLVEWWRSHRS